VPIAAHRARLRHLNQSVPASAPGLDLASGASGCAKAQGRHWQVRGRRLQLPSARLALVQFGISATNWALMASAMYLLLGGQVSYLATLGVMLAASIAGVVTPIPAGLGVLEAVYLALLAGSIRQGTLMGALLAYRALYYLVPLGGGLLLYGLLERYACAHPPSEAAGARALSPPPPR